jgi:hypothetical protein
MILILTACSKEQQSAELSTIWTIDNFTMDKEYRLICKDNSKDPTTIYVYGLFGFSYCDSNIIFKQYEPNSINFNYVVIDTSLCGYKLYKTRSKIYCRNNTTGIKLSEIGYKKIDDLIQNLRISKKNTESCILQ